MFQWDQNMIKFDDFAWLSAVSMNIQKKKKINRLLPTVCDELRSCELNHTKWKKWNKLNLVVYLILLFTCCVIFSVDNIEAYASAQFIRSIIFSAYNIYCYFFIMFFVILCFIPSLKVVFIQPKRHRRRQNRWSIALILQGKLNMLNLPCKTARLPCKIARQLLCNIATCRIPCKVLHAICCKISCNIAWCRQAL